jgi:hypothetical protein
MNLYHHYQHPTLNKISFKRKKGKKESHPTGGTAKKQYWMRNKS